MISSRTNRFTSRITVALFWLAWLSKKQIDPIIPMISGIWFACGFLLVFVAILNYITDAYRESSASAHAAASAMRSIAAVCLPLATNSMYSNLGIQWATSLLGFIAASMAIIPFIFVKYGAELRSRSPLCRLTEGVLRMTQLILECVKDINNEGGRGPDTQSHCYNISSQRLFFHYDPSLGYACSDTLL